MPYLKPTDEDAIIKLLNGLTILEDHCKRSQLAFKDFEENRGFLTKLIEYLRGKPKRNSHLSGFCTECADTLAGGGNGIGIVLLCELQESLKPYEKDVKEIQEHCKYERCDKAWEKTKELREKILNEYIVNNKKAYTRV